MHPSIAAQGGVDPTKSGSVVRDRKDIWIFTMILIGPDSPPDRRVVSGDQPALTGGGEDFILAEGPCRHITKTTDGPSAVSRTVRLCTVLNYGKTVSPCQAEQRIHVDRPASQMHGDDCTGPRPERRQNCAGGEVAGIPVDIDEDRPCADRDDAGSRRHERPAWHQHLVARANADGTQGQLKRERAVRDRHTMGDADHSGVLAFEPPSLLPGPVVDASAVQYLPDHGNLLFGEPRPVGKSCPPDGHAPVDG